MTPGLAGGFARTLPSVPAPLPTSSLIAIPGFADPVSSLSHLVGAAVFAALTVPLMRKAKRTPGGATTGRIVSLAVFSFSAVLLLSMSAVFHLLAFGSPARQIFQRLDHAAIFVLIAGTFTPIHAIMFRGPWRWGMLTFIWTVAMFGITLKSIFFRETPEVLGIALYIAMGWVGAVSGIVLARRDGIATIIPLMLGGIAYTVGAVIEGVNPRPLIAGIVRSHEIFHGAVLIGLALHWWFVWSIAAVASPQSPPTESLGRSPSPASGRNSISGAGALSSR